MLPPCIYSDFFWCFNTDPSDNNSSVRGWHCCPDSPGIYESSSGELALLGHGITKFQSGKSPIRRYFCISTERGTRCYKVFVVNDIGALQGAYETTPSFQSTDREYIRTFLERIFTLKWDLPDYERETDLRRFNAEREYQERRGRERLEQQRLSWQ